MEVAAIPEDEQQRLEALNSYQVLDTETEKEFDDLVQLAADICDTPIALISLVDPNRQWFKAAVGLDAKETPRDIAFCSHAILQKDILEVEDTFLDRRFYDNPLVLDDPNIRFYAGAQLTTPEGYKLGTLCAISDQPKKLTDKQRSSLKTIASEVIARMELHKKLRVMQLLQQQLEQKNQVLDAISQVQQLFIEKTPTQKWFSQMLSGLLAMTDCEYGFIGQVLYDDANQPYLKMRAISNLAWNAEMQNFMTENKPDGLEFRGFNSLFGEILLTRQTLISQDPASDNRAGGVPQGHPDMHNFAGIPLQIDKQFVGIVGLANSQSAYSDDFFKRIKPYTDTCAQLIAAFNLKNM